MLSKCANPECSAPFHYLREGKLFQVDPRGSSPGGPQLVSKKPARRVEHFWLCGNCAAMMTLGVEPGRGVILVPLKKPPAVRRAIAS